MTRQRIKAVLELVHVLLIFAIIIPAIYMASMEREADMIIRLYLAGYLLLVPVIVIKISAQKCKNLPLYLLVCIGMLVLVGFTAAGLGNLLLDASVITAYVLGMILETLAMAIQAYVLRTNRVRRQRAKEKMDVSWRQREFKMDKPKISLFALFVCVYLVAQNLACPEVCNIAMVSAIVYLLVAVAYQYIDRMELYLNINDNVANIPHTRIFGIGKYFLISFLFIIALAIVPATLTVQYREYKDFRAWVIEREMDYDALYGNQQQQTHSVDGMQELADTYGTPKEMPLFVKMICYFIGIIFFIGIFVAGFRWIRGELAAFAEGVTEEGDKVETLDSVDKEERIGRRRKERQQTREAAIRREYRKFIRTYRKEAPASYETPMEIETIAGVADTEAGKHMHQQYELVRYGRGE